MFPTMLPSAAPQRVSARLTNGPRVTRELLLHAFACVRSFVDKTASAGG